MIKFWFDKFNEGRASHRLRVNIPLNYLKSQGYDVDIVGPTNINKINYDDIVIFSKDSKIESMRNIKSKGNIVGFDLCDNKFDIDGYLYYPYCKEVDFITVNSQAMANVVKQETGRESYYFADCVERPFKKPRTKTKGKLNILWYGGSSSIGFMNFNHAIEEINSLNLDYEFHIVSNKIIKFQEKAQKRYNKKSEDWFDLSRVYFHEWTYELQGELMNQCDIICIPVELENKKGKDRVITKSHNRVTDGIASGRWVITTKLPSYIPLVDYTWQEKISDGIQFYLNNPKIVARKITEGQRWILNNATEEVVGKQLLGIYNKVKK